MNSSKQSLNISGRGSHGPYDAGSYKATHEDLSKYFSEEGMEKEPIFHFVFGTSIGSVNAAILASYVKEN